MGSKSAAPEQQAIILPPQPAPQEPIVFEFPEPAPPPKYPEYPQLPSQSMGETKNWQEEELKAANKAKQEKADKLRKGRQSTIKTSPLGDEEEATTRKKVLLGA